MTKLLSVVVSVYNEELALREFYAETGKILKRLPGNWDYEFLFVNDGSRDQSLSILKEFAVTILPRCSRRLIWLSNCSALSNHA